MGRKSVHFLKGVPIYDVSSVVAGSPPLGSMGWVLDPCGTELLQSSAAELTGVASADHEQAGIYMAPTEAAYGRCT